MLFIDVFKDEDKLLKPEADELYNRYLGFIKEPKKLKVADIIELEIDFAILTAKYASYYKKRFPIYSRADLRTIIPALDEIDSLRMILYKKEDCDLQSNFFNGLSIPDINSIENAFCNPMLLSTYSKSNDFSHHIDSLDTLSDEDLLALSMKMFGNTQSNPEQVVPFGPFVDYVGSLPEDKLLDLSIEVFKKPNDLCEHADCLLEVSIGGFLDLAMEMRTNIIPALTTGNGQYDLLVQRIVYDGDMGDFAIPKESSMLNVKRKLLIDVLTTSYEVIVNQKKVSMEDYLSLNSLFHYYKGLSNPQYFEQIAQLLGIIYHYVSFDTTAVVDCDKIFSK